MSGLTFEARVGARIRLLRVGHGMSVERLAEIVGVRPICVRSWEVGEKIPTLREAVPLARALDTTIDGIAGGDSPDAVGRLSADHPAPVNGFRIGHGKN